MRVLAIRGGNLASLAGPFELDLARPPLSNLGLFAITGPTGAGKSTLLDALCLALYAKTPRLGGRGGATLGGSLGRGGDGLGANDPRVLVRRGATMAFAEVDFVGADGRSWRARWQVRRARGQALGRLQPEEQSLVALGDGARVGEGKVGTLAEIERRVGLSYDELCRSVLLAQGGFAAFLKAPADERAALLEKVTGTELYSRLSMGAHQRARAERQALSDLEGAQAWRAPLDEVARAACERALEQAQALRARQDQELARAQRTARAARALHQANEALACARGELEGARGAEDAARTLASRAHAAVAAAASEHEDAQPRLLRAHLLDERLAQSSAPRLRAALLEARAAAKQASRAMLGVEEDPARLERAPSAEGALAAALVSLATAAAERQAAHQTRSETARARELRAALVQRQQEAHDRLAAASEAARTALAAIGLTVDLAAARASLVEGQACPLCGSTAHPALGHDTNGTAAEPSALERTVAALNHATRMQTEEDRARVTLMAERDTLRALEKGAELAERDHSHKEQAHARALDVARSLAREAASAAGARVEALARELEQVEDAERGSREERAALFAGAEVATVRARLTAALSGAHEQQRQAHGAIVAAHARATDAARRDEEAVGVLAAAEHERAQCGEPGDEASARAALERATEHCGAARATLAADDDARARAAALGPRIDTLRARTAVWGALDEVIGSADGTKLRVFAQSLTLDALLRHANAHLAQLAPRYRLVRIDAAGDQGARFDLELAVVDDEAGGEVRHTTTLSGGESFLLSLALALALSSLSARKTRVESLFIDEGFSALDPETLEVALAAFEALRASGRQIGVISHVPALAERIGSQVRVVKATPTRSTVLVGPG